MFSNFLNIFYFILISIFLSFSSGVVFFRSKIIIGKQLNTVFGGKPYFGFYNIPYAEPPIGNLRFKPPVHRLDVFNKTVHDFSHDSLQTSAEDCLYLSIFVPHTPQTKPVLVWLHEHSQWHGPDFFIDEEIIVVTVSFRTGIFGFLNTEDDFAEGNMGAKDILAALKWLKDNISLFNGDPDRITIAGTGLGGTAAASMLLSSRAKHLFAHVILLSATALSPADYKNFNFEVANKLFHKLSDPLKKFNRKELYELLKNETTVKLLSASRELFDSSEVRDNQRLINPFGCSLEIASKEPFMKRTPLDVYDKKIVNDVPVIIGYTTLFSLYKLQGMVKNRQLLNYLNYNFQYILPFEGKVDEYNCERYKEIKDRIMQYYFINGTLTQRSLRRYAKFLSDVELIFPVVRQSIIHSDTSNSPLYLYRFAFKGSLNIGWRNFIPNLNWSGATLDDEICYLFRCKSLHHVYSSLEPFERRFIKKIVRLFANFIKHGKPTLNQDKLVGSLCWTPLHKDKGKLLNIGKTVRMRDLPENERINFWFKLKEDFFP